MAYQEVPITVPTTNGELRARPNSRGHDGYLTGSAANGRFWSTVPGRDSSDTADDGSRKRTGHREPNTAGRATAMTMLTQLQGWGPPYLRLVLWILRHVHPLHQARALSFIHFTHFSVLDELAPGSATEGTPRRPYLLFESNFNGFWDEYIDAFCQVIRVHINALMACTEGFPGLVPARAFRAFMKNHEFAVEHYYSAYPEASTTMIRAANELAGDVDKLVTLAGRHNDAAFARAWHRLLARPRAQANLAGQACTQPGLLAHLRRFFVGRKNMAGNTYVFVALTPIQPGRVEELRTHLRHLPRQGDSPLARVPGTHFGRWVILDRVFHDSWPERFELLDPAYLLFTTVFDRTPGDAVSGYLETMLSALGADADTIWGACKGWPGPGERRTRSSYLRAHQRDAQFMLAGYPGEVGEIRRMLANRKLLVDFARQAQGLPSDQLRAAFAAAFAADAGHPARGEER